MSDASKGDSDVPNTELSRVALEILQGQRQLLTLLGNTHTPKKPAKDGWDKFSILSSFVSGVLITVIGVVFTAFYKRSETRREDAQAARDIAQKIE